MKKSALKNSLIRVPKHLIFDPNQYREQGISYLQFVVQELGNNIFVKPVIGAGSEKTLSPLNWVAFIVVLIGIYIAKLSISSAKVVE